MTDTITQELFQMMRDYPAYDEDNRFVFINEIGDPNPRARELGVQLYKAGGVHKLHDTMNALVTLLDERLQKGEDWYVFDLRQLEFCWDGIGSWKA
jgi:hypothetical protein